MDCPVCGVTLQVAPSGGGAGGGGGGVLLACSRCAGVWLDITILEQLAAEREAAMLARYRQQLHDARARELTVLRKLNCPRCAAGMMRFEYGGTSCIHIDACREHGIWFDRDELARVMQFVRSNEGNPQHDLRAGSPRPSRSSQQCGRRTGDDGGGSSWSDWIDAWDVLWLLDVIFDW